MTRHPTIGINNDLATRQPTITHRPADHEPTRRIHQKLPTQQLRVIQITRQHRLDHVLPQIILDQRLSTLTMLSRDQQLLDRDRPPIDIPHRHLRLPVRPQIRNDLRLANIRQPLRELMRQRDRQRHQLLGLIRRVPEHHPLITRTRDIERIIITRIGPRLIRLIDALRDIRRLLIDRVDHRARLVIKPELRVRIADPLDRRTRDLLNIHIRLRRDLTRDHHQPRVHQRLTRHPAQTDHHASPHPTPHQRSDRRSCPDDPRSPTPT